MGTWGIGTFENDDASDWVYELEAAKGLDVVRATLSALNDAEGYREAPTCVNALAAAEVVAALLGKPSPDLPETVVAWVSANGQLSAADIRTSAVTAVDKILDDSELKELWEETDDAEAWRTSAQHAADAAYSPSAPQLSRTPLGGRANRGEPMRVTAPAAIHFGAVTPQFTVSDLVRTVEYYRDVLGFRVVSYWDGERVSNSPGDDSVFAIVQRDQVQVFFNRGHGSEVRTGRAEGAYDAYFSVTGLDGLAAELRSRGAEIIDGPEDRSYGQRELVVRDCNGLIFAFGEDRGGRAT